MSQISASIKSPVVISFPAPPAPLVNYSVQPRLLIVVKRTMHSARVVQEVGRTLNDSSKTLAERFRALFTLRGLGGEGAIAEIVRTFSDSSVLLKHECAYCLGQMQDPVAIPTLVKLLSDPSQDGMVRHEAGEALGAIGDPGCEEILCRYCDDPVQELAQTCQVAVERIRWLRELDGRVFVDNSLYSSVDPAPPTLEGDVASWRQQLCASSLPLFERYKALFALRNLGGKEAVSALLSAMGDSSVLLKHEVAYVLGQMQDQNAVQGLIAVLVCKEENPMVRHECAEALGTIASEDCLQTLTQFLHDQERVVRESCEVALDMYQYEHSQEFQYTNVAYMQTN